MLIKNILFVVVSFCFLHTIYTQDETTDVKKPADLENSVDVEKPDTIIENEDNTMRMGQKVEEVNTQKEVNGFLLNVSEYRFLLKKTPNDKPYGIYDGLIKAKDQVLLKNYLTFDNSAWLFNNYDADDENKQRTYDNTAWINDQDPLSFSTSKLCEKMIAAVRDVSGDAGPYYPYRVFGKIIRRGDHTKVSIDSQDDSEFSAMIFVNEFWRKNYYGELYFYDDNKEIVGGATHKSARLVVWRSDIYRLNRPPAVQFLRGQVLFQVQFTKDKRKMIEGQKKTEQYLQSRKEAHSKWNIPEYEIPGGIENLDIEKHKTFEFTTQTHKRKIFVYDNLFSKDLLDHLRSFVLQHGTYFYDDSIDETSDNVQWIAGFPLNPYIKSPYWKIIQKAASKATGNHDMFPYDVSINLVRNADHTRIHQDVGYPGEEEFTCLVYLNPNWEKNFYGETTFFEKNSDDTEIVAQVRPRYGRLVIFDGNIPHSARPPSFNFSGARLTFVTKLHRNEYTGRRKNFQEDLRFFRGIVSSNRQIKIFSSDAGEKYAQRQLEQLRDMSIKLTYKPEKGEEEGEGEEEEEEEEEGQSEKLGEDKQLEENLKLGKRFVVRRETPILDDEEEADGITKKLVRPLYDISEESPDALEVLQNTHTLMSEKYEIFLQRLSKKLMEVM